MENFEEEISSIDEETSSLFNNESLSDKKSDDINNDYDDTEDTRSELKFERSNFYKIFVNGFITLVFQQWKRKKRLRKGY